MKILMIIAKDGYQDTEYEDPKKILEQYGHTVLSASTAKTATGSLGGETNVDLLLDEVHVDDFDGVIFVGGPGAHTYFDNKKALSLAQNFYNKDKLTCAICAGPSILANAGILNGKTVTSFIGQAENIKSKGAIFTGKPVEQDGKIITANGPGAAKDFGKSIAKALAN